eukprot:2422216-Pyramimonas_sp.AAC.1
MIVGEFLPSENRGGRVQCFDAPAWTCSPLSPLRSSYAAPIWLTVTAHPTHQGASRTQKLHTFVAQASSDVSVVFVMYLCE